MDPFYKIGEKPSLDNMADYIAAFVKLRYKKNQRFTIVAISYGFAVVTKMLQRYPDIAKRVNLLFSFSGLTNKDDFRWKKRNIILLYIGAWIFTNRFMAFLATKLALRAPVIKLFYRLAEAKHPKLKDANKEERNARIDFEIKLWKINDFRTWLYSATTMFRLNLSGHHVDLPVYHLSVDDDHYFNQVKVEEHMRQIYKDFMLIKTKTKAHAPTIMASAKDVAPLVPSKVRALLRKQP
jgi:pimeloyl-ACP methyl ester carboxylesterase